MAILTKITNLINSALGAVQLKDDTEDDGTPEDRPMIHIEKLHTASRAVLPEPLNRECFSLVDSLMAKTAFRAARDIPESADELLSSEMEIDLTDVVMSIETQYEQKDSFREASGASRMAIAADGSIVDHATGENDPLDHKAKYESQRTQCLDMIHQGWEQDTVLAYLKLDRRGFEPLFPNSWRMDFVLFPPILFTENEDTAFIRSLSKKHWRAIREFDNFCKAGVEVRVAQLNHTHPGRRPEAILAKHIKKYIDWAWYDADLGDRVKQGRLPRLLPVMCAKQEETARADRAELLQERLLGQLRFSGDELLAMFENGAEDVKRIDPADVPSLFGFAVVDALVGVIAYEPLTRTSRSIGFFNFDDRHLEVMHTISLAIVIHWVRHGFLRLQRTLECNETQLPHRWIPHRAKEQNDSDIDV